MKKNKTMKLIMAVLLVTIIALVLVAGTYAKYTSTISGKDTAVVAKWKITNGDAVKSIDIFGESKIYDLKGVTDFTTAGTVDSDVKQATQGENGIIAPGTWGKFSYEVTNDSDVNATYSVTYTLDNAGVPLKWSVDGKTWNDTLTNVSNKAINMGAKETISIYWKWEFNGDDTALGTAAQSATPSLQVSTTFTQVD